MTAKITDKEAAEIFASMGNPMRLQILRLLIQAGDKGLVVGDLQRRTGIPASTLAHHISKLATAGVIDQVKQGRAVWSIADYNTLSRATAYLMEDCCAGLLPSA